MLHQIRKTGVAILLLYGTALPGQVNQAGQVVSRYRNLFIAPPTKIPSTVAVDAPLLGNGSFLAAIAGPPDEQTYYLSRNDFWRLQSGNNQSYPAALGSLKIKIADLKNAGYKIEQDLYNAQTISHFTKQDVNVQMTSYISATKDRLIIEIENKGAHRITGNIQLSLPDKPGQTKANDTLSAGISNGTSWIQRGFLKDITIKTFSAAAVAIMDQSSDSFSIAPGKKTVLVCATTSNFKQGDPLAFVQTELTAMNTRELAVTAQQHLKWWHQFWNESMVQIGDSIIEHQYYRSQYTLASCSRDPKFPPGIFGSWVSKEPPAWNGDYHLNYNYEAPFYALYSSNHLQQALPYEAPLLDFMPRGKYYAKKITGIGDDAILYPVGIGPLGIETTDGLFLGQKSNAVYGAINMINRFYKTYDRTYAQKVYPYLRATAVFWQQYLKPENGRYIIEQDAVHEGTDNDKNPIVSLALVRLLFKATIDMGALLKKDEGLRSDLAQKLSHLANYTTQERNGKTVFRYTEKGTAWWPDNTVGIQHVYPAGQIGLESDAEALAIAKHTIQEMQRWQDFNGSNSFFPAAVRVGYDADTILKELHAYSLHTYPNGFQLNNPHGIENCSTVPNTINEMLCMGNQGVLRVFAVWPKNSDAAFENIRSDGAFLVSSAIKNMQVQYIKIISEQGNTCTLQNPWPGKWVLVKSNKKNTVKKSGEKISLATVKGEVLTIFGN